MKQKADRNVSGAARLLLVDDNPSGLAARTMVLTELGYEITPARSAEEALEHFAASPFPVVVTDYKMPGRNGVELIAELRILAPDTRVVLISGFVDGMGLTEENTGADAVIMKSANEVQQLVRSVNRLSKRASAKAPGRAKAVSKVKSASASS